MWFKDLHLMLKAFRVRRFFNGDVSGNGKRETEFRKRPSWMVPGSHGYHVVDDHCEFNGEPNLNSNSDSVVQKEQIEDLELWYFEPKLRRKSKETLTKAYLGARAKIREAEKAEETWKVGSASPIVINGERHVVANMGEYRAVVCRDGEAHLISWRQQQGVVRMSKVRTSKSSEVVVGDERIDPHTEFVILASNGIWEMMKHQEAVNLIRHMEDPQEVAECLAREALTRVSRSNISCLVIHFD
ncbi:hypothetical protein TEA_015989 [Camellia sinensis var. sinensis]|uniref:PPM-type phosphatase domain-containing protein n=1 Tax=Camellia sinensis var. sinensis TaxID=542762 RepID=A0A4S4EDC6_CAMSN|nr:hypothetical protein TEA_015989 [Camellia sinensis var. sinensis]